MTGTEDGPALASAFCPPFKDKTNDRLARFVIHQFMSPRSRMGEVYEGQQHGLPFKAQPHRFEDTRGDSRETARGPIDSSKRNYAARSVSPSNPGQIYANLPDVRNAAADFLFMTMQGIASGRHAGRAAFAKGLDLSASDERFRFRQMIAALPCNPQPHGMCIEDHHHKMSAAIAPASASRIRHGFFDFGLARPNYQTGTTVLSLPAAARNDPP